MERIGEVLQERGREEKDKNKLLKRLIEEYEAKKRQGLINSVEDFIEQREN